MHQHDYKDLQMYQALFWFHICLGINIDYKEVLQQTYNFHFLSQLLSDIKRVHE